jgi:hypothetical protein
VQNRTHLLSLMVVVAAVPLACTVLWLAGWLAGWLMFGDEEVLAFAGCGRVSHSQGRERRAAGGTTDNNNNNNNNKTTTTKTTTARNLARSVRFASTHHFADGCWAGLSFRGE